VSDRSLSPLESVIAEAIARSRHYINLAAVDVVDDGEPDEIRQVARVVAAAVQKDHDSAARLRAALLEFCDGAEAHQKTKAAWVPTPALRYLISDEDGNGQ
jgi:hypothetical protein